MQNGLTAVTVSSWNELKTKCEEGGNDITLSAAFNGTAYPGRINLVSGKRCIIRGGKKILDAKASGSFFNAAVNSELEVHDLVMKNGKGGWYSGCTAGSCSDGGAISARGAKIKLYDCVFERSGKATA